MEEHILVCLSSSPSNAKIIQAAAKMAKAFNAAFTALYVKTSQTQSPQDNKRLQDNTKLAQNLGARIETIFGDDVAYQITEYSRLSYVTKIVVGRSGISNSHFFLKPTLVDKLIVQARDIDVYIIPDTVENVPAHIQQPKKKTFFINKKDILKSVLVLVITSCICLIFFRLGFSESSMIALYILSVMVTAIITQDRSYSLVSSILSVLVFNFFFTAPKFSLRVYESDYPVTMLVMFLVSFITGTLTVKLKDFAQQSTRTAFRTKVLFDTNQLLQKTNSSEEIVSVMASQIQKLLSRSVIVYIKEKETLLEPYIFLSDPTIDKTIFTEPEERKVANWVSVHNKQAGASTPRFSEVQCLYLALRINQQVYGVVGIPMNEEGLEPFENSILLSILGESALAIENYQNAKEKEEAAILAENERLRANMLRSISHDLRTPLTSISGNASNLLSNGKMFNDDTKQQIYADIYDDSLWLINLVENLLSVTRIEDGHMNLNLSFELMEEIVEEALKHVNRNKVDHHIRVICDEDFLLAQVDPKLIVQVFINLIDNAIKYTEKGSHIDIFMARKDQYVEVRVQDDGIGISDEVKEHVFDMFYSGSNRIADSRRSLGLGLALCRSIVNAHGGMIKVEDNKPHGTVFTFTLPVKEVKINE